LCKEFGILGDIVNASKPNEISHSNPIVAEAKNIYEVIKWTEYRDKQGTYKHIQTIVCVKLSDNSERDLFEIIVNIINLGIEELNQLGVIKDYPKINKASGRNPRRPKKSGELTLDILNRGIKLVNF